MGRVARGFSFLELTVVVALIGILLAVALPRLLPYVHEAERVSVMTVETTLRDALVMATVKRIAAGQTAEIPRLARTNPMQLLLETPSNYVGEFDAPLLSEMPERSWFFDSKTRALFYRAGAGLADPARDDMPPYRAYVVDIDWHDGNADGEFSPSSDELYGVRLIRVAEVGLFSLADTGR